MKAKICINGVHGVGKTRICEKVMKRHLLDPKTEDYEKYYTGINTAISDPCNYFNLKFIKEQFREVVKDLKRNDITPQTKQTEEMTLETYARQLALECRYKSLGKNILCDRSVLDPFVYYEYFNNIDNIFSDSVVRSDKVFFNSALGAFNYIQSYSKIYLIEPSDREIENDGFRMTDKKQQLEIHELFLEYFKDCKNVEILNQEDANKEEFIEKVANQFII